MSSKLDRFKRMVEPRKHKGMMVDGDIIARASQLWCIPEHGKKVMDSAFCMDIARLVQEIRNQTWDEAGVRIKELTGDLYKSKKLKEYHEFKRR